MKTLIVGARPSPLSRAQVKEVLLELQEHELFVRFIPYFQPSTGDLHQNVSLRGLDKTDFFTREIDALLLNKKCDIAIHSAKDLPDPLPEGIDIAAITKGVSEWDSLVMREGQRFEALPPGALIATSSERREEAVRILRNDLKFIDLRGTIEKRLEHLDKRTADGVVVAEAALIRLGLTHLNRIRVPGEAAPLQGKLAICIRKEDDKLRQFFFPLDIRCAGSILV